MRTMKFPIFLFSCLAASLSWSADTVRIHGSDLFDPWLQDFLLNSEALASEGYSLDFSLRGSYSGRAAVEKGFADVCFFIEDAPSPTPEGFDKVLIAYHVTYLYAPESFPDYSIGKDTILRIAAEGHSEPIFSWGEIFPEDPEWQSKQTSILINPGYKGISLSLFKLGFMEGRKLQQGPETQVSIGSHEQAQLENASVIYVSSEPSSQLQNYKQLALRDFGDSAAFPPTEENIRYEDYGAVTPIYLITPTDASFTDMLKSVCSSDVFKALLIEHHLHPTQ
jgi:hypothetical protein